MGDADTSDRHNMLRAFQVDDKIMAAAAKDAITVPSRSRMYVRMPWR